MTTDQSEEREPGLAMRWLSLVHPGVRRVARQIGPHAAAWEALSAVSLASDPASPVWLALGDSTAQGIGPADIAGGYVRQLHAALAARRDPRLAALAALPLVNLSVSGARARDLLADQIPRAVALERPFGLVTCTIGSNDLMRDATGRSRPDLVGVIDALADLGAPITVIASLPHAAVSVSGRLVNQTIRAEASRRGVLLADVRETVGSWRGKLAADGFHPNERGYADYATAFARAIEDGLSSGFSSGADGPSPEPTPDPAARA